MTYVTEDELACKCCGRYKFADDFLYILNQIREECGFPLPVTSGYRCERHPIEADKKATGRPLGAHNRGVGVDIGVSGERAHRLIEVALKHGIPRIGVNQRGAARFIHLDIDTQGPRPTIWSY